MLNKAKGLVIAGSAAVVGIASTVGPAMATGEAFLVTSTDLAPITSTITGNVAVLLPVGLTILAIMVGVSMIPRILQKFF